MSILSNVVTASVSGAIEKNHRVTIVASSSIALTLPVFDDANINQNTRFIINIPTGITSVVIGTVDGTTFFENGLTTFAIPSEGQYEFIIVNGFWYVYKHQTSASSSASRYIHVPITDTGSFIVASTYRVLIVPHNDFIGYTLTSCQFSNYAVGGRGTNTYRLNKNGVGIGLAINQNETQLCVQQTYSEVHASCDRYTVTVSAVSGGGAPVGLAVDLRFDP